MRKLFKRRPSAGVIIGILALVLALGGGAYAASKKIPYKGLDKDARLKVLPISATNAGTDAVRSDQRRDVHRLHLGIDRRSPRRSLAVYMLTFDGIFDGVGGSPAATAA